MSSVRVSLLVSADVPWALNQALAWADAGDDVSVVLLDASTAAVRPDHCDAPKVSAAMDAGVAVHAHNAALRRRGLARLLDGVKIVDLDEVAVLVTDGADRAVWV